MRIRNLVGQSASSLVHSRIFSLTHVLSDLATDNAYACDPRIARFKQEAKERKLKEKEARKEAARRKAEEEEKVVSCEVASHQCICS